LRPDGETPAVRRADTSGIRFSQEQAGDGFRFGSPARHATICDPDGRTPCRLQFGRERAFSQEHAGNACRFAKFCAVFLRHNRKDGETPAAGSASRMA